MSSHECLEELAAREPQEAARGLAVCHAAAEDVSRRRHLLPPHPINQLKASSSGSRTPLRFAEPSGGGGFEVTPRRHLQPTCLGRFPVNAAGGIYWRCGAYVPSPACLRSNDATTSDIQEGKQRWCHRILDLIGMSSSPWRCNDVQLPSPQHRS
jgi:hypothetical protein